MKKGFLTANNEISLIDKFHDALFVIDLHKNIIKVNSSACSMTGYKENELLKLKMDELDPYNPKLKGSKLKKFFMDSNTKTTGSSMNTMQLKKNGKLYHTESRYYVLNELENPLMVIITKDMTEVKILEQSLVLRKNQSIRSLYEGQEIERKRIAKEMHDSIGQMLATIKLSIATIADLTKKEQRKKINTIDYLLESVIDDVRRIYENLFPRVLEQFGLRISLENLCEQIQDITNIKIDFKFVGRERELDDHIANSIYRISQEAINNTIKYADATEIHLRLSFFTNNIELMIKDNGKGFDITNLDIMQSHGLNNMKERSETLNGIINIQSEKKKGTKIKVNIPIK